MSLPDSIPHATADKLLTEYPKGTRHKAALDIAFSLVGTGMPPAVVFATLRSKFPLDVTDKELQDIVDGAVSKRPDPPRGNGTSTGYARTYPTRAAAVIRTPVEMVDWWVSGNRTEPHQMVAASPLEIPADPKEATKLAIGSLYKATDSINVVCKFIQDEGKARPCGGGKALRRDDWVSYIEKNGIPQSDAGAWVRPNPCNPIGSGKDGAITDSDIASFQFLLVESDMLPLPMQLALFRRLRLPISAVILSGGSSAHAWVRLNAASASQYKEFADRIFAALKPFGIDQANSNPSRLSRLPGAVRVIGAAGSGQQQLVWLNPNAAGITEADILRFEESLKWPAIEEKPMLAIARAAADRYQWLYQNRGRLGVPYGVPDLDSISGGMKPGQTIVVAGVTGGGKTTFALHMVKEALKANYGVLLFSLEMDKEEIFDLLVSDRCSISRNKFNTGNFFDGDLTTLGEEMPKVAKLPLYIEDAASVSAEDIRLRTMQLKADNKINLVVVDYVQFVNPMFTKESREQQVAAISHTLRALAREIRLPIVVLSQLNDEGRLRESRVIAHNANVVIMVEIVEPAEIPDGMQPYEVMCEVLLKVVKGRGIPCSDYKMDFDRMYSRITPKARPANP